MKVYDITGPKPAVAARRTNGTADEVDFRTLLQAEMAAAGRVNAVSAPVAATAAGGVSPSVRLEGLSLSENALAVLENYADALNNPSFKSEDLEPFIAFLEENTGGLLAVKGQLSADDPLAGVLERVAAVSFLEAAKFRRGDYTG